MCAAQGIARSLRYSRKPLRSAEGWLSERVLVSSWDGGYEYCRFIAIAAFAENDDGTTAEHHTRPGIEVFLLLAFTEQATLWTVLT